MFARLLAVLLVFAWADLAALELLEDIRRIPGEGVYAQSSKIYAPGFGRVAGLTDNTGDSAANLPADPVALTEQASSASDPDPLSAFYRVVNLHKLHRVYLI